MASLRKRNNRWEVRVRHRGQPTQTKTFTLKSEECPLHDKCQNR